MTAERFHPSPHSLANGPETNNQPVRSHDLPLQELSPFVIGLLRAMNGPELQPVERLPEHPFRHGFRLRMSGRVLTGFLTKRSERRMIKASGRRLKPVNTRTVDQQVEEHLAKLCSEDFPAAIDNIKRVRGDDLA